jgi:hypothetical protein
VKISGLLLPEGQKFTARQPLGGGAIVLTPRLIGMAGHRMR